MLLIFERNRNAIRRIGRHKTSSKYVFAGESVSSTLELQHAQDQVTRAAQVLVLSCEGTVERKQAADTLLKSVLPSLAFLRREVRQDHVV